MKTLIVAATQAEVAPTLAHFNLSGQSFLQTEKFDILITGVGMVATAFALGKTLSSKYNLVVNVGIAGSFGKQIALGTIVEVGTDIFAELGAEDQDNFITLPQLGFGDNEFEASVNPNLGLPFKKAITVNKVHGNAQSIKKTVQSFNPQVESMEGAAVFYACQKLNIAVKQVRAISNHVEPRNRDNWQIGLAVKNLNNWLIGFILKLEA